MRVSHVSLLGILAPVVAWAFLPQSLKINIPTQTSRRYPTGSIPNAGGRSTSWSQDAWCSFTQLNMAWKEPDQHSNIFDGPMALTKERDACGVGFIANTKEGGKQAGKIWTGGEDDGRFITHWYL